MRAQHILIAVLVFSLVSVTLVQQASDFVQVYNNGTDLYNNTGALNSTLQELNVLLDTQTQVAEAGDKVPGGVDANSPSDSQTSDGNLQKSGLQTVASIGNLLFKLPKLIILGVGRVLSQFFGLPKVICKYCSNFNNNNRSNLINWFCIEE